MNENLQSRIKDLHKEINFHNYRYHVLDDPVISDSEFDKLMAELKEIETEHPELVTQDSPTQRVGSILSEGFRKIEHPAPILSLGNAFGGEEVIAWYERLVRLNERVKNAEFVVEPKIDGLSVVLHYRDGLFIQGATRGNGEIGDAVACGIDARGSRGLHVLADGLESQPRVGSGHPPQDNVSNHQHTEDRIKIRQV